MIKANLTTEIRAVENIDETLREAMFALMARYYDAIDFDTFTSDLAAKDEVILLFNTAKQLCGFSTLAWFSAEKNHTDYDVVFSGDTIIDQAYWGSQELVKEFCRRAGKWQAENKRRLFWLLISKGHRTYLYLPLFTRKFYPSPTDNDPALAKILDSISSQLFAGYWNSKTGIIRFDQSRGQLKNQLATGSFVRSNKPSVAFFLAKNPGYAKGDELACIAELSEKNLRRTARDAFLEGGNS